METVSVGVPVFKSKIKEHDQLKKSVLNAMDNSKDGYLKDFDTKDDLIHKLYYDNSADFNRPWVKIIGNSVLEELNNMATSVGYIRALVHNIWYQSYNQDGRHGWHTHGSNYTGVYYLNFKKDKHPKTDIKLPLVRNVQFFLDVEEGYIIAFPSFFKHRAPKNNYHLTKTIISFNFDLINE